MNVSPASSGFVSRQHFEILDGLRGVAALAVVIFHFMEIIHPDPTKNFIAHAYLAVDFFFCLSGFVIAYSYDKRLNKIGLWNFFKLRLIRLHVLVISGALLGLLTFILDPFSDLYKLYESKALWMFISSCLMIPYPIVEERYFNLFHLNPPTWSLFWEYFANLIYALFYHRMGRKLLVLFCIAGGVLLCFQAAGSGHLSVGWGGDNILGGGVRVLYSFTAGLLIYRFNWLLKSRLGITGLSLLLVAVFVSPFVAAFNSVVEPALVIFILPVLVSLGAGSVRNNCHSKFCRLSGEISYPLYMLHYPFIWIYFSWVQSVKPDMVLMVQVMIVSVPILILFSYVAMRWIDKPVRTLLRRRLLS